MFQYSANERTGHIPPLGVVIAVERRNPIVQVVSEGAKHFRPECQLSGHLRHLWEEVVFRLSAGRADLFAEFQRCRGLEDNISGSFGALEVVRGGVLRPSSIIARIQRF